MEELNNNFVSTDGRDVYKCILCDNVWKQPKSYKSLTQPRCECGSISVWKLAE